MDFVSPAWQARSTLIGLCVAIGIGLLIGAERERRKSTSPDRSAAGIRTFTVVALLGAVGFLVGGVVLTGIALALVGAGALIAYQRTRHQDPGMTTEFALVLTCLLGALAISNPVLAAGVGAVLALLLAARNRMHHFVRSVLSEQELHDIILFCATALIVLPMAPDRFMGPFGALNPYDAARLIVAVMAISACGHVAMRWLGPKYGLPLAGFASGFVSSAATIYAMGQKAAGNPALMGAAVSAAVLSSFSTIVQMAIVIAMVQPALLLAMVVPLTLGGSVAALYALVILARGTQDQEPTEAMETGHAFSLKTSVGFAALLSVVLILSAGLNATLGGAGALLAAAIAGLADAHATAASAASLLSASKIGAREAMQAILIGLSANTATKIVLAYQSGGRLYALKIVPGLLLMLAAVWLGFALAR
jgi:uncharacterized membrane protein (DUF4010 family)